MSFSWREFIGNSAALVVTKYSGLLVAAMLSPSVHGIDAYVMDVANSQCSSNIQRKINVRYVAADGNDANDGLTPATAWRTIAKLNSGLPSGGAALLRCGDVFYGMIEVKGGIDSAHRTVITSYGNGPKPVISCNSALLKVSFLLIF